VARQNAPFHALFGRFGRPDGWQFRAFSRRDGCPPRPSGAGSKVTPAW
jgi:hypothetical protein